MRITILLYFVLIQTFAFAQKDIFPEQIAFEYFKNEISKEHFDNEVKFIVNRKIKEYNSHYWIKCENDSLDDQYLNVVTLNVFPAPTDSAIAAQKKYFIKSDSIFSDKVEDDRFIDKPRFTERKNIRTLSVIENISVIPNFYLVTISVVSNEIETNFFIEVDDNGNIIRWCSGIWHY